MKAIALGVRNFVNGLGVTGSSALSNYPKFQLLLTSGVLDRRVDFSRTSNATITNSAGLIAYAPHNLLSASEQFDNAAWSKARTDITANQAVAPDGTTTADLISTTAATSAGEQYARVSRSDIGVLTYSIYVKKYNHRYVAISLVNYSIFDFDTNTFTTTGAGETVSYTALSNGWYRLTATATCAGSHNINVSIATNSTTVAWVTPVTGTGFYIWGAQLEIGTTATTYNSTTVKNLLGYSELFDNAAWTKSNSFVQTNLLTYSEDFTVAGWAKTTITPVANSIAAPNGYATADTLPAAGANSLVLQTYTAANVAYTFSVWLKRKTGTGNIDITVDGTTYVTKTITTDWARYDTTLTPAAGAKTAGIRIVTSGDEVYAWGAQLVQGSVAGDYRRTDAAALPIYYANHNGVVCVEQIHASAGNGTILESYTATGGSSTFSVWIRRITGTGNVDLTMDSGSTYTTQTITSSWARYSITSAPTAGAKTAGIRLVTSGDVVQVFGAMVSDSASLDPYVLNAGAAPTAAAYYGPRFDYDPVTLQPKGLLIEEQRTNLVLNSTIDGANLATQNVTVTAQAYTLSFYGTGQIVLSGTASATVTGTGAYPSRKTLTFTPTAGTLTLTVTGTVQYAQLEAGSFATSYIPTGASQATRTADVATVNGSNFYSWYNQNEGSFTVTSDSLSISSSKSQNLISVFLSATELQRLWQWSGAPSTMRYSVVAATVNSVELPLTITANTMNKYAVGYARNNFAYDLNAGTVQTDTSSETTSNLNTLFIGNSASTDFLCGHIKSIAYYPTRLSDATIKGLTA